MKVKLGILGSGGVAQTLGAAFAAKGYEVMLGTRDTAKLQEWLAKVGDDASVGSFSDAAKFGDVIFLSVLGEAVPQVIALAGKENFDGKAVVDLTNPLDFSKGVPPKFTATVGDSLGERVQRALPNAKVVKAFNSIGASIMIDPKFGSETATHFIAGDDESAKAEVTSLIREFGWDVEDLGSIDQSFFLEAFASMWINYGFKYNNWTHAFKFLKK